jgi:hypothetical protein
MRLQFQPDRFPVLRRRFHYYFSHFLLLQPTDQALTFLGTGSESLADKSATSAAAMATTTINTFWCMSIAAIL